MISRDKLQGLLDGGTVVGPDGNKIGKVGQIFLDDRSDEPRWVTVKTGLFGGGESFVPLDGGDVDGNQLRVPYDKAKIKDGPRLDDAEGHLSPEQESELFRYYQQDDSGRPSDEPADRAGGTDRRPERDEREATAGAADRDTTSTTTDQAGTPSEEQLNAGTQRRESGRTRLRKYVVTEQVALTVPVSHEEVRVERVGMDAETVEGQERVEGEVREERIGAETDVDTSGPIGRGRD